MRPPRFRFGPFTLSPSRRLLLRGDKEVPLIPRYLDLLLLLVARRNEAVSKDEIFDFVWSDVIVTDGALTQAVRILRKSLGDRAKEPRFIRTVSRHGYRFVYTDVIEEPDELGAENGGLEQAVSRLLGAEMPATEEEEEELREAAETVLRLGGEEALQRLEGHPVARAIVRDVRWNLAEVGPVSLSSVGAIRALVGLRTRDTSGLVRRRWVGATLGGAASGLLGGFLGGLVLMGGPGATATSSVLVALPLVGLVVGALGAFGVGGGLAWAEALVRSFRGVALVTLGAMGGGLVGGLAHFVGRFTVEGLFGRDLSPVAGGFEGLVIGAAMGAGYALGTPLSQGGMATPRGWARLGAAAAAGLAGAVACLLLAVTGHHLGAMSIDLMAHSFPGSQVRLEPLARLLGESHPWIWTRGVISGFEGFLFGVGLVWGLTGRHRTRTSQNGGE